MRTKSIAVLNPVANRMGVTLIELLVVVGVMVILVAVLGFEFEDWIARYKIESEAKDLYTIFMNAKARAMSLGSPHYVWISPFDPKRFIVFEDANDDYSPDAPFVVDRTGPYKLVNNAARPTFGFNAKGIVVCFNPRVVIDKSFFVRVIHTKEPDYDCLEFNRTRINLGLFENGKCETR